MGGDGGSIPKRGDVVRTAGYKFVRNLGGMGYTPNTQVHSAAERYKDSEIRNLRWSHCNASQEPLRKPIVACRLGNLYNKEAIVSGLLHKTLPVEAKHIKSLRDIVEVKNANINYKTGFLTCPISLADLEGGMKGCVNWSCGCIISEKAMKNLLPKQEANCCLCCGKQCGPSDLIWLLRGQTEHDDKVKTSTAKIRKSSKRAFNEESKLGAIDNPITSATTDTAADEEYAKHETKPKLDSKLPRSKKQSLAVI